MWTGRQNRGAHQRARNILSGVAPVLPRFVGRPLTNAEDSLIPSAPDARAHDGDGYNSCAFEEGSPLHLSANDLSYINVDENEQIAYRRMVAGPGIRGIVAK